MINIKNKNLEGYKFIDLFAGLGGFRIALESLGAKCVYSNEWDKAVCQVYKDNFGDYPDGDITKVDEKKYLIMIYYVRDFRVRHFRLAEIREDLRTVEALCFLTWQEL